MIRWKTGVRDGVCACQETLGSFTAIMALKTPLSSVSLQASWHDALPTSSLVVFWGFLGVCVFEFLLTRSCLLPCAARPIPDLQLCHQAGAGEMHGEDCASRPDAGPGVRWVRFSPSCAVVTHPDWLDWTSHVRVLAKGFYLSAVNRKCDTWQQIV